eukprot:COSAG02_NODE_3337_length_6908_cov_4.516375_4_plen_139_part_00
MARPPTLVRPSTPDRTDDIIGAVRGAARQQTRDASVGRRRQTGQITQAIADAAQRGELNAVQLAAVEDNLKDAPLTAQMVAQGRLKPQVTGSPGTNMVYRPTTPLKIDASHLIGARLLLLVCFGALRTAFCLSLTFLI